MTRSWVRTLIRKPLFGVFMSLTPPSADDGASAYRYARLCKRGSKSTPRPTYPSIELLDCATKMPPFQIPQQTLSFAPDAKQSCSWTSGFKQKLICR